MSKGVVGASVYGGPRIHNDEEGPTYKSQIHNDEEKPTYKSKGARANVYGRPQIHNNEEGPTYRSRIHNDEEGPTYRSEDAAGASVYGEPKGELQRSQGGKGAVGEPVDTAVDAEELRNTAANQPNRHRSRDTVTTCTKMAS